MNKPRIEFNFPNVTFYFGGLLAIASLSWFLVEAWERLAGGGLLAIALAYAAAFATLGYRFSVKTETRVPGGILVTAAVWMTPLAVYGLERMLDLWPSANPGSYSNYYTRVHGSWIAMELATLAAGAFALRFVKFPFIVFPMAVAAWFLSMDVAPLILGVPELTESSRKWVSVAVGLAMMVASRAVDRRAKEDYAFWGYLFGLLAFWGGLSLLDSNHEFGKFVYALINVGLIFLSVRLKRRTFIVFGAIGVFGYLGHLSRTVFPDAIAFPILMSAIGVGILLLGVRKKTGV